MTLLKLFAPNDVVWIHTRNAHHAQAHAHAVWIIHSTDGKWAPHTPGLCSMQDVEGEARLVCAFRELPLQEKAGNKRVYKPACVQDILPDQWTGKT